MPNMFSSVNSSLRITLMWTYVNSLAANAYLNPQIKVKHSNVKRKVWSRKINSICFATSLHKIVHFVHKNVVGCSLRLNTADEVEYKTKIDVVFSLGNLTKEEVFVIKFKHLDDLIELSSLFYFRKYSLCCIMCVQINCPCFSSLDKKKISYLLIYTICAFHMSRYLLHVN